MVFFFARVLFFFAGLFFFFLRPFDEEGEVSDAILVHIPTKRAKDTARQLISWRVRSDLVTTLVPALAREND